MVLDADLMKANGTMPFKERIERIAREIYGANGVEYSEKASKALDSCSASSRKR